MSSNNSSQFKICVLDSLTGARAVVDRFAFIIGFNQSSDLRMSESGRLGMSCLVSAGAHNQASVHLPEPMVADGVCSRSLLSHGGEENTVAVAAAVHTFRLTADLKQRMAGIARSFYPRQPILPRFPQGIWAGHHLLRP